MVKSNEKFNENLKLLAKTSIIVFFSVIFSKIFTYLYRIIIARSFGPEVYGILTLSIMITGWFIALSSLGLNSGLARYIPLLRAKNKKTEISFLFRNSLKLCFFSNIIICSLLIFFADKIAINIFHEPILTTFLRFFIISVPLTVFFELFLSIFVGYERISSYSFFHKIITGMVKVSLLVLFITIGMSYSSIYFSYLLSIIIPFAIVIFLSILMFPFIFDSKKKSSNKEKKLFSEMLSYSWPLMFYGFIWQIFHWTDSFIIGVFKTTTDVGIYNSAVQIAFLMTISSGLFIQLFFPMITREFASGNKEIVKQLSKQVGKWIFFINLPMLLLLILYPDSFIQFFFGKEYISAGNSLRFLGIGLFFFSIFEVSNKLISMRGKSKIVLMNIIITSIFNIILNLILISKYGITGVAFSTMLSFMLLSCLFCLQSYRLYKIIPLRRKMLNLIFSSLISAGILIFIKSFIPYNICSFLLLILTFSLLYIFFSFVFNAFDRHDFLIIKSLFKKMKTISNFSYPE